MRFIGLFRAILHHFVSGNYLAVETYSLKLYRPAIYYRYRCPHIPINNGNGGNPRTKLPQILFLLAPMNLKSINLPAQKNIIIFDIYSIVMWCQLYA